MRYLFACLIAILCSSIYCVVDVQIDTTFCSIDTIVPDDGKNFPLPYRNESEKYRVIVEHNSLGYGQEIIELYDGEKDRAFAHYKAAGGETFIYVFGDVNELLLITEGRCVELPADLSVPGVPFKIIKVGDKYHIATPLTLLSQNPNLTFAYLGSTNRLVRGIPAREWQACAYSEKEDSTLKITISYSNPDIWESGNYFGLRSVPIQVRIQTKFRNGTIDNDVYSLTQYRSNARFGDGDFSLPNGIYCANRKTKKQYPVIPKAFSYIAHQIIENVKAEGKFGVFEVYAFEYDSEKKLIRSDSFNLEKERITLIADLNTNLFYEINRNEDYCSVTLQSLSFPPDIFGLDDLPAPEYVGRRNVRGIPTNVWSAPRNNGDLKFILEWHFMAEGWTAVESNVFVSGQEPVQVTATTIKNPFDPIEIPTLRFNLEMSNFNSKRIDLYDFDVSLCEDVTSRIFGFSITTDNATYIAGSVNEVELRDSIFVSVKNSAKVGYIRISQLYVVLERTKFFVTFTLRERSKLVSSESDAVSLNDAYNNLAKDIQNSALKASFLNVFTNKTVTVTADKNSLIELKSRTNTRYTFNDINKGTLGTGTGVVVFLAILFVVIGIAIGLVGGVFLFIKGSVNLPLPGPLNYFNPNFNQDS